MMIQLMILRKALVDFLEKGHDSAVLLAAFLVQDIGQGNAQYYRHCHHCSKIAWETTAMALVSVAREPTTSSVKLRYIPSWNAKNALSGISWVKTPVGRKGCVSDSLRQPLV